MKTDTIRMTVVSLCGMAMLALEGCAAPGSSDGKAPPPSTAVATQQQARKDCNADAVQYVVGQIYTPELEEKVRQLSGSAVVRTLRPGDVVTMEYRLDRVSIHLDDKDIITRVSCG